MIKSDSIILLTFSDPFFAGAAARVGASKHLDPLR